MAVIQQRTTIIVDGLNVLKTIEMQKVFVVTDPFLLKTDAFASLQAALEGKTVEIFSDITPDPPIDQVIKGIKKMSELKPDTVIAIGGGSAIDAAKGMRYFYQKSESVGAIKFIAIPTTSGTGSEVTNFSIITDPDKGVKYPLVTWDVIPDIAILDKELVKTVPPKVTVDTGMDVLTHCLEAYVSPKANDYSDLYAEKAFSYVFKYLPTCYKDGSNDEAREKMHIASNMAGLSFNIASLGLNHGIAHAAGARFHVPHGRMNTILLPDIIAYNAGLDGHETEETLHARDRYAQLAHYAGIEAYQPKQAVNALIREIKKLRREFSMPETLTEYGIKKEDVLAQLEDTAKAAMADSCTETNPRTPTLEEVKEIIGKIC